MITSIKNYIISCNGCHKPLEYPMDSTFTAFQGHTIHEDTVQNIKSVAKDMGWDENNELCPKCKSK